jgi:hypothetical protein
MRRPASGWLLWGAGTTNSRAVGGRWAAAVHDGRRTLARMFATCRWTVCRLTIMRCAISASLRPSATTQQHLALAARSGPVGGRRLLTLDRGLTCSEEPDQRVEHRRAVSSYGRWTSHSSAISRAPSMSERTRSGRRAANADALQPPKETPSKATWPTLSSATSASSAVRALRRARRDRRRDPIGRSAPCRSGSRCVRASSVEEPAVFG